MLVRGAMITLALMLMAASGPAQAFDDAMYPDISGQWLVVRAPVGGQITFDPLKAWGKGQQAPLTAEYQAVWEASLADQANGGQGNWRSGERCMPPGMPAMMNGYGDMEIVLHPEVTHILIEHNTGSSRRIFTDGRDWPKEIEPTYRGYSIGRWLDEDGDGRFDVLQVETRFLKGPRAVDPTGIPMHTDNQTVVKERFFIDKADPRLLRDELTLIDNAFTHPWTVLKTFRRSPAVYPNWREESCPAVTALIKIGTEMYYKGADGNLLPTRKDQPPPDLKYFDQARR